MRNPDPTTPVVDLATGALGTVTFGTPAWSALIEWVEAHGLNPNLIVASTGIVRDADRCRILYVEFVCDDDGRRLLDDSREALQQRGAVEQGEAPPLPFPDIVLAQLHHQTAQEA